MNEPLIACTALTCEYRLEAKLAQMILWTERRSSLCNVRSVEGVLLVVDVDLVRARLRVERREGETEPVVHSIGLVMEKREHIV